MSLQIEKIKFPTGKELQIMKKNFATGKKILKEEGYQQCPNELFLQKENSIAHYNKTMKIWIFDQEE